jgi:hypothetical protein
VWQVVLRLKALGVSKNVATCCSPNVQVRVACAKRKGHPWRWPVVSWVGGESYAARFRLHQPTVIPRTASKDHMTSVEGSGITLGPGAR